MVEIINVKEMKELAAIGKEEFEKTVLEGPTFKSIVRQIEEAACKGYTGWYKDLDSSDDIRELKVIQKALIGAGYKCEFKSNQAKTLLGFYTSRNTFSVDWD